jgi:SAM-dependent methyltransferase
MSGSREAAAAARSYGRPMETRTIAQAAALARIDELAATGHQRAMWALGDYHAFAKATVWSLGPKLVEACGIAAGQRVLDVAAGTGNVAIRAAEAGASVVASDICPENFEAGRREAGDISVEWVEADARALPFADGEFDVVTSALGAIFAPDHRAVAGEMLRVCRPGGTIGMLNFAPAIDDFFAVFAPYGPTPGDRPGLWGSEERVRELFGHDVDALELTRIEYVERAESPRAYADLFRRTFGPVAALYARLAGEPARTAALDRDLLALATNANQGPPGGPAEYPYECLLMVARRAGS